MPTNYEQLFRFNRWANRLTLNACRDLTPQQLGTSLEGGYGELGRTIAHLVSAEAGYVWRFEPDTDRFSWDDETDPVPPIASLLDVMETSGTRLVELARMTPDDAFVEYTIEGEERRWPAWVVLDQAIDHGREHRSHIATTLTQLGIQPPDMDVWAFMEAGAPD
jgi:uncharacterized damage-inducible protein DinB